MPYKFIDHTADIAVEVEGSSLNELFMSSCYAWREAAMDISSFQKESSKKFIFNAPSLEVLLTELLSELNFQLYTKSWVFVTIQNLLIEQTESGYQLEIELFGQKHDLEIHKLKVEIKAVTYHKMKIVKEGNKFKTIVVFDI
ncbi:MAG TPA: archease [Melioribacteraceae bacterium]|nr:archease [Melioribacteraceae bacterium]